MFETFFDKHYLITLSKYAASTYDVLFLLQFSLWNIKYC